MEKNRSVSNPYLGRISTKNIHIQMYLMYAFILVILLSAAIMSVTETWIFKPYKRGYAPPGISDGHNKSPYTQNT